MLFCGAVIVTQWFKSQAPKQRRLFYIVIVLSVIGAILSGGRGTLAFVLALFAIFLIIQRRIGILLGFFAATSVLVGAVNVVPGAVKNAPQLVRRSLNWALFEKDVDVSENISGSSNWRYALFRRAIDEWQSDPRIYWFGRATYSYGMEDVIALSIAGEEDASIESSLRRGASHSMLSDLLVVFGLVGLVLFFSLYFSALFCLWQIYRAPQIDELAKMLALVIFISLSFNFVYSLLGGGNFPTVMAWLIAILIAYLHHVNRETELAKPAARIEPPKASRLFMPPVGGALRAGNRP
jgi:predicted membrane protein